LSSIYFIPQSKVVSTAVLPDPRRSTILVLICCSWIRILVLAWSLWTAVRDTVTISQAFASNTLRQLANILLVIIASNVQYSLANSEAAIDCLDYQPPILKQY